MLCVSEAAALARIALLLQLCLIPGTNNTQTNTQITKKLNKQNNKTKQKRQPPDFRYDTVASLPFAAPGGRRLGLRGPIHAGFASGFEALWPAVAAQRGNGTAADVKHELFTFAGHSQGGPIAAMLAAAVRRLVFDACSHPPPALPRPVPCCV